MNKKRTGKSLKDLFKEEIGSKEARSQRVKALKRRDVKTSKIEEKPKRHTIYLSPELSKKLRLYAAEHGIRLSKVVERLIDKNL